MGFPFGFPVAPTLTFGNASTSDDRPLGPRLQADGFAESTPKKQLILRRRFSVFANVFAEPKIHGENGRMNHSEKWGKMGINLTREEWELGIGKNIWISSGWTRLTMEKLWFDGDIPRWLGQNSSMCHWLVLNHQMNHRISETYWFTL